MSDFVPSSFEEAHMIRQARELYEEGFGLTETRNTLRSYGYKFGNSAFRGIWDAITGANPLHISFVPGTETPGEDVFYASAISFKAKYRFLVTYTARNPLTGEEFPDIAHYDTNELMPINDLLAVIATAIEEGSPLPVGFMITEISFLNAFRSDL